MSEQEPSEEELRAQLEQQIRELRVEDVLLQTVVTLVNLSGRRLTIEEEHDPEQARLGIEAVRALLPLCPQDQVQPIRDALSQLQMIYARDVGQPGAPPAADQAAPAAQPAAEQPDPEREKARSKLWTPPGT